MSNNQSENRELDLMFKEVKRLEQRHNESMVRIGKSILIVGFASLLLGGFLGYQLA